MLKNRKTCSVVILVSILIKASCYQVGNNRFHRGEVLDLEGKYVLEWEVDWGAGRVNFSVKVETTGWVGFGLSTDGKSSGSDIVIGGVKENGYIYFSDRHIKRENGVPILDKSQDWTLYSGWEDGDYTFLKFARAFDTCDPEDYQITPNRINLVWAYGLNDNVDGLNHLRRGIYKVHLLDPDYAPEILRDKTTGDPKLIIDNRNEQIPRDVKTWSVRRSVTLPPNETSYICSMHKAPTLNQKHHVIGYDVHFPNALSRPYVHHFLVWKCHPPPGSSSRAIFQSHLDNDGETCYFIQYVGSTDSIPGYYCSEIYTGWTVGGKSFFFPPNLGFPFGDTGPDEYYLFQLHYNNPDKLSDLTVDIQMDFFYAQGNYQDAGVLTLGQVTPELPESIVVPPNSIGHRVFSHCSTECTTRMLPTSGVNIVAVPPHSHSAGQGLKLRHFRGGKELPWIVYDDNYDNLFQSTRHLKNEIKILPGDQLTSECRYASPNRTVVSGFSTSQEMCNMPIVVYPKLKEYSHCVSGINSDKARLEHLGVGNVTWNQDRLEWIAQTPQKFKDMTISEVSDNFIDWNAEKRKSLQRFHEFHTHIGGCHKDLYVRDPETIEMILQIPPGTPLPPVMDTQDDFRGPVEYPLGSIPYSLPSRKCQKQELGWGR